MFQVGPFELVVLAIVGVVVIGPDRLPGFARQAAQMIRTLRDLATGARQQLRDELGPEFADVDLRNLNPRTAVRRALFDDDFDFDSLDPRRRIRDAVLGDEDLQAADPRRVMRESAAGTARDGGTANGRAGANGVRMTKPNRGSTTKPVSGSMPSGLGVPDAATSPARPRPRPRPGPGTGSAAFQADGTDDVT